jgi:glycosyltransferase involved in cell wall biosynthesis
MKVCFVVLNEMLTGVVPSQVLAPARAWAAAFPEVSVRVIFLEAARIAWSRAARTRLRELRALAPAIQLHLCPYVGRLGENAPALSLAALLWSTLKSQAGAPPRPPGGRPPGGRLVLHCRGPEATLQAVAAVGRKGRVVLDARGAAAPETQLRLQAAGGHEADVIARAVLAESARERRAVHAADAVSAVSAALLRRLTDHFDPDDARPLTVVPCCVEEPTFDPAARAEMRQRLGIKPDEVLLVHTSTEARWEDFPRVRALFRAVHARRQARLLFLTTLPEEEVTAGLAAGDPLRSALLVRRAEPDEVAAYLAAADAGLLLRKPHEAFRFASPIKLAEYLAAGLAVAVSEGTGTAAALVERRGLGVVVPPAAGDPAGGLEAAAGRLLGLLGEGAAQRERALAACRDLFVWRRYAPEVARLYGLPASQGTTAPVDAQLDETGGALSSAFTAIGSARGGAWQAESTRPGGGPP